MIRSSCTGWMVIPPSACTPPAATRDPSPPVELQCPDGPAPVALAVLQRWRQTWMSLTRFSSLKSPESHGTLSLLYSCVQICVHLMELSDRLESLWMGLPESIELFQTDFRPQLGQMTLTMRTPHLCTHIIRHTLTVTTG